MSKSFKFIRWALVSGSLTAAAIASAQPASADIFGGIGRGVGGVIGGVGRGVGGVRVSEWHRWPIFLADEDRQGDWLWDFGASAVGARSTSRTD